LENLQKLGKQNALNGYEVVRAIHLESDAFSVENDLLTPTLKSRRPNLRRKYTDVIAQLYAENAHLK